MNTLKFNFSINGAWLTKFIQDGVMYEGKGYEWAEQTVNELLKPNGLDEATAKKITQDIILGRGRFSGNTGDGTFVYDDESYGTPDDFFLLFSRIDKERKDNRQAYTDINNAWCELAELITGEIKRSDLTCAPNLQFKEKSPLEEYIERMTDEESEAREPYGFISPDGEFHNVEWGEHGEWAETYIKESGLLVDAENSRYCYPTDYLVHEKGWLLMHSPSRGKPKLTAGDKPMTKAQRETLYDYYIKAERDEEANALFVDTL
ncbi:MAG: hypothetical protein IJ124_14395 [Clostridia bacterium]|nr:hypothetical protein [Clostridia bacterium]